MIVTTCMFLKTSATVDHTQQTLSPVFLVSYSNKYKACNHNDLNCVQMCLTGKHIAVFLIYGVCMHIQFEANVR